MDVESSAWGGCACHADDGCRDLLAVPIGNRGLELGDAFARNHRLSAAAIRDAAGAALNIPAPRLAGCDSLATFRLT
jgi:hypothetical protein